MGYQSELTQTHLAGWIGGLAFLLGFVHSSALALCSGDTLAQHPFGGPERNSAGAGSASWRREDRRGSEVAGFGARPASCQQITRSISSPSLVWDAGDVSCFGLCIQLSGLGLAVASLCHPWDIWETSARIGTG